MKNSGLSFVSRFKNANAYWFLLAAALILVMLGPTVWVTLLGFDKPIFPYNYPTLFAMLANLVCAFWFSVTDKSNRAITESQSFGTQWIQSEIGPVKERS